MNRYHETQTRRSKQKEAIYLEVAYQNAWEKLKEYYNRTDEAYSIYAAATLLHPSHRKAYFTKHWSRGWKSEAMINVEVS